MDGLRSTERNRNQANLRALKWLCPKYSKSAPQVAQATLDKGQRSKSNQNKSIFIEFLQL
jgi:hypothetical protein